MHSVTAAVKNTAAVVLVFLLLAGCGESGEKLTLRDADTGKLIARYDVSEGDEFSVAFTHSVNKTDVTEIYEVRDSRIYLTGCVYYSFGAGVAEELDPSWTLGYGDNGEMIISDINMELPDLVYVVGTVSDHTLYIGGTSYSLRQLCGQNRDVSFDIEN